MQSLRHYPERGVLVKPSRAEDFARFGIPRCVLTPPTDLAEVQIPAADRGYKDFHGRMTIPRDQGTGFHCTSFCVVGLLEFFYHHSGDPTGYPDFSESHLAHDAERKYGDCTKGLAIVHAMQVAMESGVTDGWEYDPT